MAPSAIGATHGRNQKTNEAAATESVFEGEGENVSADDHNDLGADRKNEGISNSDSKTGALQDAPEVFQTHEMHFGIANAGVAEGVKDSRKKGPPTQHNIKNRR